MKIGIYGNSDNPKALSLIGSFIPFLDRENIDYVIDESLISILPVKTAKEKFKKISSLIKSVYIIFCFGGDGTLLQLGRLVGAVGTPILSINLGRLGFLAEISPDELEQTTLEILKKKFSIEKRIVLKANVNGKEYYAVNDLVVDRGNFPKTIKIIVKIDGQYFNTYVSDGLIVATPTGSTAYSLSAGGPILSPEIHNILLNPICPHSLTARSIIFPDDVTIEIYYESEEAENVSLYTDSQVCIKINKGEIIKINKADHYFNLITLKKETFYQVLRKKLNWGEEIRR